MRFIPLLIGAIASGVAAPALASTLTANLETAAPGRFVAGDTLWNCTTNTCTAANDYGRAVVQCQSLAKQAGPVSTFAANGIALGADDLAKCNSRARKGTEAKVAAK